MNLRRIVDQFPGENLRRIDLMFGEKELWGRGYGTEANALLNPCGHDLSTRPGLRLLKPPPLTLFPHYG